MAQYSAPVVIARTVGRYSLTDSTGHYRTELARYLFDDRSCKPTRQEQPVKGSVETSGYQFLWEETMETKSTAAATKPSADDASGSLIDQILTAIAESDGRSIEELDPLYDVIDPEALETLFAPKVSGSPRPVGEVSFQYVGYWVTVSSNGAIEITFEER